jgi:hypothetical protein
MFDNCLMKNVFDHSLSLVPATNLKKGGGNNDVHMCRVGQNHIYMVFIRYFRQRYHHIYSHIRCIYIKSTYVHECDQEAPRIQEIMLSALIFDWDGVCMCVCTHVLEHKNISSSSCSSQGTVV